MRVLFDAEAGAIEEALLVAQERLRYLWCAHLARPPGTSRLCFDLRWQTGHTRADAQCDLILRECLATLPFPVNLVSEEYLPQSQSNTSFSLLIDPLDGTHNASAGYPMYTASVALYNGKQYVFGWVYDISRDVAYIAAADSGAFIKTPLVCEQLQARSVTSVAELGLAFLRGRDSNKRQRLVDLFWLAGKVRLSSCSSLDLCHIAMGSLDAFLDLSAGHERSCDIAAAALILVEAGGVVLKPDGLARTIIPPAAAALEDYGPLVACGSAGTASLVLKFLESQGEGLC